jgi:hypothetical protein
LGVTADNAKVNDVMIEELSDLVEAFPGQTNQTRCFSHILNLVAKAVIKIFDAPMKRKKGIEGDDDGTSDAEAMLAKLAEGIDLEEHEMRASLDIDNVDDDDDADLQDEVVLLSPQERMEFERTITPVRVVIVKVSAFECAAVFP